MRRITTSNLRGTGLSKLAISGKGWIEGVLAITRSNDFKIRLPKNFPKKFQGHMS